jgi:Holliday junction DNA helicase RuvA
MITRIKGLIVHIAEKFVVVDVSGVGYKVHVTNDTLLTCELNNQIILWTYTAVRENSLDLFGFPNTEELNFFELLLDVSGIGPRSALGILGIAPIETLAKAIATGDTSYLNKVSGIGRKTAEKIVIELRDKLKMFKGENSDSLRDEGDVIEALKSLGYSQSEARDALKQVPEDVEGTNAKIKQALKMLSNK